MTQSRMAGVAMGIGADDLASLGNLAGKLGMEAGGDQAGILVDLSTMRKHARNDGHNEVVVMDRTKQNRITPQGGGQASMPLRGGYGREYSNAVPSSEQQFWINEMQRKGGGATGKFSNPVDPRRHDMSTLYDIMM